LTIKGFGDGPKELRGSQYFNPDYIPFGIKLNVDAWRHLDKFLFPTTPSHDVHGVTPLVVTNEP